MSAQVAADLRAAADVLERRGWCQVDYRTEDGRMCAMGALMGVTDAGVSLRPHKLVFFDAVGKFPVSYNDTPGRTADEVIAALRAAADKADQS